MLAPTDTVEVELSKLLESEDTLDDVARRLNLFANLLMGYGEKRDTLTNDNINDIGDVLSGCARQISAVANSLARARGVSRGIDALTGKA